MSKDNKEKFQSASQIARQGNGGKGAYVPEYEDPQAELPQRIVAASAAIQKRGKSTYGFSMPKPLAYLQLDANYEHALKKARDKCGKKKDDIRHLSYFADPRADIKAANKAVWERLVRDFEYCVENFKSVLVDTTSELLDVRKLGEFGRNTQILQIYYGGFYADLRWMVKHALNNNANVLFLHRMKKEYVNDAWSGGYELEGWKGIVFEAQVYIEHDRDADGVFSTTIKECAQDALLIGTTLSTTEDDNDFAGLATKIYPDTDRKDWE